MDASVNIVLFGFMGTGKSTVGRILQKNLKRKFIDMDAEIERREGCTIPEIFSARGEAHFRELEHALVRELSAQEGLIIATGGGVVLNPENVKLFSEKGLAICLRASPEILLSRVSKSSHRPLLDGDADDRIRDLLAERLPLYEQLPYQIDTDELEPRQIAMVIHSILDPDKNP